jgi:uncharacterized membrane protein YbaN (DUF454 family)
MVKRSISFIAGCLLIVLGLIGFILPILPGFIPFIIGIVMVSRSSETARSYLSKLKTLFPRQYEEFHKIRVKLFGDK